MKRYIFIIPYDGYPEKIEVDYDVVSYDALKALIAALPHPFEWFEIVVCKTRNGQMCDMYLDEEGKLCLGWYDRINVLATELYGSSHDCIVGDALIFAHKSGSEDTHTMTEAEADAFIKSL